MSERRSARHARPSQVLTLPDEPPGWDPPAGPSWPSEHGDGRSLTRRVVAVLAGLVVLSVALTWGGGGERRPVPQLDVATTDAVVAVLRLYAAEVAVSDATAAGVDPFAVPGPAARSRQVSLATADLREVLTDLRGQDIASGTPGGTYIDHPDHEALLALADRVAVDAALLGYLGDVHASLYRGAGVVSLPQARQRLLDEVLPTAGPDAALHWGRLLVGAIDGTAAPADTERARVDAAAAWTAEATRVGPAAGADLAAFLNGIDPAVLDVLDGHPIAGPALRRLR